MLNQRFLRKLSKYIKTVTPKTEGSRGKFTQNCLVQYATFHYNEKIGFLFIFYDTIHLSWRYDTFVMAIRYICHGDTIHLSWNKYLQDSLNHPHFKSH